MNIALSAKCRKRSNAVFLSGIGKYKAVVSYLFSRQSRPAAFFINSPQPLRHTGIESGI